MIYRPAALLALLLLLGSLAGCGQKGALYLPQPEEPAPTGQDGDNQ